MCDIWLTVTICATAVAFCSPRLLSFLLKRVKKSGMEALNFLTRDFLSYWQGVVWQARPFNFLMKRVKKSG